MKSFQAFFSTFLTMFWKLILQVPPSFSPQESDQNLKGSRAWYLWCKTQAEEVSRPAECHGGDRPQESLVFSAQSVSTVGHY